MRKEKVLVIDDEKIIRELVSQSINKKGFAEAVPCKTSAEALEQARRLRGRCVIAVSDYNLGDNNGLDTISRVREIVGARIPALLVTSCLRGELPARLGQRVEYVRKPFDLPKLLSRIGEARAKTISE